MKMRHWEFGGRWWCHVSWLDRPFWHWPELGFGRSFAGVRFGGFAIWIGRLRIMGGRGCP